MKDRYCIVCMAPDPDRHHVRTCYNAGVGKKPDDIYCIDLCRAHHSELHQIGEKTFWEKHRVNPFEEIVKKLAQGQ